MKKLIMFLMVFTISMPALGELADVPPEWGAGNIHTAVWDFETEPLLDVWDESSPPTCITPEAGSFLATIFDPTWEGGVMTGSIWFAVEVPEGGSYITLRVQCHLPEGGPGPLFVEGQFMDCVSTEVDGCRLDEPYDEISDPEVIDDVVIYEFTVERGDIVSAGGFIQGGPYEDPEDPAGYRGIIVDIIAHDDPEPPTGGPRQSSCFSIPAIAVDSNDMPVYEPYDDGGPPVDGPTEGQLLVSLGWQPGEGVGYPEEFEATVVIDPNINGIAPNDDFVFPAGAPHPPTGPPGQPFGFVTLTFDETNWDIPQPVAVEAVKDLDREGNESYPIELTVTIDIADPNFGSDPCSPVVVEASVGVVDNDVPFVVAIPDGIELSESDPCVCVELKVRLSHDPTDDVYVRVYPEEWAFEEPAIASLDPPLTPDGPDPNVLTFTTVDDAVFDPCTMTSGWNVEQTITVCPIDDDELKEAWVEWIEGEIYLPCYSQDVRYLVPWFNPDGSETEDSGGEADEEMVSVLVQDNDCGAVGFARSDFNENCRVGLGDFVHFYSQWLTCIQPYDDADACDKLWNLIPPEED